MGEAYVMVLMTYVQEVIMRSKGCHAARRVEELNWLQVKTLWKSMMGREELALPNPRIISVESLAESTEIS